MQLDYVTVERRGPIALVRFDRRENLNAFNQKLVRELTAKFKAQGPYELTDTLFRYRDGRFTRFGSR